MKCKFNEAWIGQCEAEADENGFCEKHKGKVCCSCGKPTTHNCDETMGLVCGAPLCDDCEHTIHSVFMGIARLRVNGCNSGGELPKV